MVETAMQNLSGGIRKQKLIFALFAFAPLFLAFALPFIFFKFPLRVAGTYAVLNNHAVYQAMAMVMGLFGRLQCAQAQHEHCHCCIEPCVVL